jgi:hypothetical protein
MSMVALKGMVLLPTEKTTYLELDWSKRGIEDRKCRIISMNMYIRHIK